MHRIPRVLCKTPAAGRKHGVVLRIEGHLKRVVILLCIWALSGCVSSLYPRPADTTPAKHWAVEVDSSLLAVSADEAQVRDPSGKTKTSRDAGGNIEEAGGPMPFFVPEVIGRFGLTERIEVAAIGGPLRFAGEVRAGLLAERRKNPLSMALAIAGGYQPFFNRSGPWLRAGLDMSRQTRTLLVMTNLYVTYGSETHAFILDLPARPEDATTADGAPQHAQVTRREIRFLPSIAVGTRVPSGYAMIGIVPWFVVRAWAPDRLSCDGCLPGYAVNDFRESFGVSLVVGGAFRQGF